MGLDRCSIAVRLPVQFDSERLQQDLSHIDEQRWQLHSEAGQLYSHGWSELALVSSGGRPDALWGRPDAQSGPFLKTAALGSCDYLNTVVDYFQCHKKLCRLLRLNAGAEIFPHRDREAYFRNTVRLHIPIRTHPDVEFVVKNKCLSMQPGEVWYMNGLQVHFVRNLSPVDRVHLVLDCDVNEFITALFREVVGPFAFGLHMFKKRYGWYETPAALRQRARAARNLIRRLLG